MVFSSPVFLFIFLPACLLAALVAAGLDRAIAAGRGARRGDAIGHRVQNLVLLTFSTVFYLYGSGKHLLVMIAAIAVSYIAGLLLARPGSRRTPILVVAVAIQIMALAFFKYAGFLHGEVAAVAFRFNIALPPLPPVVLPIGISFFVFQSVSYVVDVYRDDARAQRNPFDLALYIILFPQLIAGPIVRYTHVELELARRRTPLDVVARGAVRFIYGLSKKVLVADSVAVLADAAFALPAAELTTPAAAIGALAYTLQIYFDFSAYSDMGIGLGHMFGFRFPENFNRPFSATSITDFWRRWHITLSTWFRDYVYRPLGGSLGSSAQTYRNLWIVFLLSGLWHGASWTFVAWGAFHGALLTIERLLGFHSVAPAKAWRRAVTFVLVVLGFTLFRAESFPQAISFYGQLLWPTDWSLPITVIEELSPRNLSFAAVACASLFFSPSFVVGRFLEECNDTVAHLARLSIVTIAATMTASVIASSNFSPFIYFRF